MYISLRFVFVGCRILTAYPIHSLVFAINPLYLIRRNRGNVYREVLGLKRLSQVSTATPWLQKLAYHQEAFLPLLKDRANLLRPGMKQRVCTNRGKGWLVQENVALATE